MIRTENLSLHLGSFYLNQVSLHIEQGSYFVLLGPPGSGKSVFLQCLCGLKYADAGSIYIADRDVTRLEPRQRGIGYVPQDYDLFPHLSVEQNIAFGLREQKKYHKGSSPDYRHRVHQMADMLGITHLLKRSIAGLSGGERQRVALARALVLEPQVLVLDEPVSALDEATRQDICQQLLAVQRKLHLTVIHVSHVLEEAFTVADRAGILHNGIVKQVGPIGELLRKPANEFVARFMRCENIFPVKVISRNEQQNTTTVQCGSVRLIVSGLYSADNLKIAVRPECISLTNNETLHNSNQTAVPVVSEVINSFAVTAKNWRDCGIHIRMELVGSLDMTAYVSLADFTRLQISTDSNRELTASLPPEDIHVFRE